VKIDETVLVDQVRLFTTVFKRMYDKAKEEDKTILERIDSDEARLFDYIEKRQFFPARELLWGIQREIMRCLQDNSRMQVKLINTSDYLNESRIYLDRFEESIKFGDIEEDKKEEENE